MGVDWRSPVLEFEELSRLLKQKGIDFNDPGRVVDPVEIRKERILARDEERTKKQHERHVLTKAMSNHPIPKLFVSRRNDKFRMALIAVYVRRMCPSCPMGPEVIGGTLSA